MKALRAGSGSGGGPSFKGAKHRVPIVGPLLIVLAFSLFVFCGGGGEKQRASSVRDDAPAGEGTRGAPAAEPAPSLSDRANSLIVSVASVARTTAWQGSLIAICVIPILGIRLGYKVLDNRAKYVKVNALDGDVLATWDDMATLGPSSVHKYQESLVYKGEYPSSLTHLQIMERKAEPAAGPPPPPLVCPSYEELREAGVFKPDQLLLGVSREGPVYRSPKKHGSGYITALSGYGKSNEKAFLICQTLDQGGIVDLLDIHSVKDESLVNYLGPLANESVLGRPMGTDAASVKQRLREIKAELYEMLDRGSNGRPRLIAADEGNALATHADRELRGLFLDVAQMCAQQMRAFNVSMVASIQHPTVQDLGGKTHGGAIRDCFGWSLCGKVPYKMAPIALRIAAANAPKDTEGLEPGEFYIVEGVRPVFLKTPLVTKADFVEVARQRLAGERQTGEARYSRPEAALRPADGFEVLEAPEDVPEAPASQGRALVEDVDDTADEPLPAKLARLYREGLTERQIAVECWGRDAVDDRGRLPKRYADQIRAAVAQAMSGMVSPLEGGAPMPNDADLMD